MKKRTVISVMNWMQGVIEYFSLNRLLIIGTGLLGFGGVALSSQLSWFDVPIANEGSAAGLTLIASSEPWFTRYFQLAALVVLLLMFASWLWFRRWNQVSVTIACLWLMTTFVFPYFVMVHDPPIAARATWMQMQHDHLIWLGGDVNTSQENSKQGWKAHVYVVDAPRQVSVIKLPSWSPLEVGLDRLPHLIEWLGFTNAFCQFARKGWIVAFVGGSALLLTTYFRAGKVDLQRVGYSIGLLASTGFLYCAVAWSVPFRATSSLSLAGHHTVHGRYREALDALCRAGDELPIMKEDTYYIAQRGLLEYHLGRTSLFADMYSANLKEQSAYYHQALVEYRSVIRQAPKDSALRREAGRALLRFGVHSLNSGDNRQAIEQLEEMLTIEPCNLKAIYMLQIAYLRSGNNHELYQLVDHVYRVCEHLGFPTKKIILATAQQHAAFAAMLDHDIDETWRRWIKLRRP